MGPERHLAFAVVRRAPRRRLKALLCVLCALAPGVTRPDVLESTRSPDDFALTADPDRPHWSSAPSVIIDRDYLDRPIDGRPTEVRARWTDEHLYLLYVCPYTELNLKPDPRLTEETPRLWNWDVAEAFIGSDAGRIGRYKEFQVSPQGEWVDLDIDRDDPETPVRPDWNSGIVVKARIDERARTWYGEMRIPFRDLDIQAPRPGLELRLGLYRIAGADPRAYYAWQPTGQTTFHVPAAFGRLRLR